MTAYKVPARVTSTFFNLDCVRTVSKQKKGIIWGITFTQPDGTHAYWYVKPGDWLVIDDDGCSYAMNGEQYQRYITEREK